MAFSVRPIISDSTDLATFFNDWQVDRGDLLLTNKYVIAPHLGEDNPPCDVLYQEEYGMGEPSDIMVDAMLDAIRGKEYSRIIAIGGGTVIDIAKLFVFGGDYDCNQLFDLGPELERKRELVIIPTTCGTGSEVTNISIVELTRKKTKKGLAVPQLYANEAVLIPSMLSTLPYDVFATSSIDALIHAVESYVSPKANTFTRAMGGAAIRLILGGYQKLAGTGARKLPEGGDMKAFSDASTMAGIAFGNAGCAAVHALSYPIGGNYHVPHGKANYMVFSEVFVTYRTLNADLSALEALLADVLNCAQNAVWDELFALLSKIYDNQPLNELGVDAAKCAEMAASCFENQQRLLGNNPVALDTKQIEGIYLRCM